METVKVIVVRIKIQDEGNSFRHLRVGSSNCMMLLLALGAGFKGKTMTWSAV